MPDDKPAGQFFFSCDEAFDVVQPVVEVADIELHFPAFYLTLVLEYSLSEAVEDNDLHFSCCKGSMLKVHFVCGGVGENEQFTRE